MTDPWTLEQALVAARTAHLTAERELAGAEDVRASVGVGDETDPDADADDDG